MKLLSIVLAAFLSLVSLLATAQSYPSKPVRLIIPFAPGGVVDTVGRALARRLEVQLGQAVIVENRTGGGTLVGTTAVANAAPDGYTVLVVDPSVAITPTLQPTTSYDLKQLRTLATLTTAPLMVVVHPSLPVQNLKELVEFSKKSPQGVTYASPGTGTTPHLAPELLRVQSGFNGVQVGYRGGGPSIPDLISGRVQTAFYSNATVLPLINDGRLRAIAQTGTRRTPSSQNVPTGVESGFPDFVVELWTALFAPAGLPPEVERRLVAEAAKAAESEEFNALVRKAGLEPFYKDSAAAEQFVLAERDRWAALIKAAKITVN